MINYGFKKEIDLAFEDAVLKVTEELKKEGFGVLTKIDIKEKFKEKLNIDYKNYVILGACNPPNAYKALEGEPDIGLLLPCNVIVYENEDKTVIAVIKPTIAMASIDNSHLKGLAQEIESILEKVFNKI